MKNKFVSIMVKILIMILIIGSIVFAFYIYSNAKESEDKHKTNKIEEEISYLETKITELINSLNRYTA